MKLTTALWLVLVALIAAAVAVFAVGNAQSVEVHFLGWQAMPSLALLVLGAFICGGAIVGVVSLPGRIRLGLRLRSLERQLGAGAGRAGSDAGTGRAPAGAGVGQAATGEVASPPGLGPEPAVPTAGAGAAGLAEPGGGGGFGAHTPDAASEQDAGAAAEDRGGGSVAPAPSQDPPLPPVRP